MRQFPEKEHVDVDLTGGVAVAAGRTPERSLDLIARVEEALGLELGLDREAGVEEVALPGGALLRLGLVDRRGGEHADARDGVDPLAGGPQVREPVALVRAEAEVAAATAGGQSPRSFDTSTATSSTGRGIGGSGFAARTVTSSTP